MGEVIDQVQHEFWRPPVPAVSDAVTSQDLSEACRKCGTEFIVGSRFCHNCGVLRPGIHAERALPALPKVPGLADFIALGERLGLSVASFTAFVVGVVCLVGAMGIGVIFSAKTMLDWQAIQLWRIEWLLGAIAAFVAGILLRKSRSS